MSRGGSSRGRGQQSTHRRTGADRQAREKSGRGVRGRACDKAPRGERAKRRPIGATVVTATTLVQAAAAGVAPSGQHGGGGGGGEGGALPVDGAVRGAGAHGAPAPSPPIPGAGAKHHLPAGDWVKEGKVRAPGWTGGVERGAQRTTQWRTAEKGRAGRAGQGSSDGAPRPAGGRAREWELAKWTGRQRGAGQGCRAGRKPPQQAQWVRCARDRRGARGAPGKGTREGRTPRSRQQGARESRASGQRAGEGAGTWGHQYSRGRYWDGGEVLSRQPSTHLGRHLTLR